MSFEQMGFNPEEQLNKEEKEGEKEEKKEGADLEIDEDIKRGIEDNLNKGFLDSANIVAKKGQVNKKAMEKIVEENVLDNFNNRNHKDVLHILKYYNIGDDFLKNKTFIELGKNRVEMKISQGDIDGAYEVLKDLDIDEKFLETEEALEAAKIGIRNILPTDDINKALKVQGFFNIDDAFMREAAEEEIKVRLNDNLAVGAISLQKKFDVSEEFMKEAITEEVLSRLSSGNGLEGIALFISKMEIDKGFLRDEKVKAAIEERTKKMMGGHGQEKIPDIFKGI
jgi:hypothetical protein